VPRRMPLLLLQFSASGGLCPLQSASGDLCPLWTAAHATRLTNPAGVAPSVRAAFCAVAAPASGVPCCVFSPLSRGASERAAVDSCSAISKRHPGDTASHSCSSSLTAES
jgi:hypothetical protein